MSERKHFLTSGPDVIALRTVEAKLRAEVAALRAQLAAVTKERDELREAVKAGREATASAPTRTREFRCNAWLDGVTCGLPPNHKGYHEAVWSQHLSAAPSEPSPPSEPLAEVLLSTGRMFLSVAGRTVAVEGDPCRDDRLAASAWTTADLERVAAEINAAAPEKTKAPEQRPLPRQLDPATIDYDPANYNPPETKAPDDG